MLDDNTYIQAALEETVMVTEDGVEVLTNAPYISGMLGGDGVSTHREMEGRDE